MFLKTKEKQEISASTVAFFSCPILQVKKATVLAESSFFFSSQTYRRSDAVSRSFSGKCCTFLSYLTIYFVILPFKAFLLSLCLILKYKYLLTGNAYHSQYGKGLVSFWGCHHRIPSELFWHFL